MPDRQRLAEQQTADTKILQKVNAVHRDAFAVKYPAQVEHCLRLTMERLHNGLDKRSGIDLGKTNTWLMSTAELADLGELAYHLNEIRKGF